ncbi:MAG: 6-bladed beta-propeller [Candidatus Aminicenantales bacterium]
MRRLKKKDWRYKVFVILFISPLATARANQLKSLAVREIPYPSPAESRMLARPADLEVDGEKLFILDSQERKIKVFSFEGKWLYDIGRYGSGPGEFLHPVDMSINGDEVAVLDSEAYQVKFFSGDGNFSGSFKTGFRGHRLLYANEERLVVSRLPRYKEKNASFLFCFDRKGKLLGQSLKVSSVGSSAADFIQFSHDLHRGKGWLGLVKKFGQEMVLFLDGEGKVISTLKIAANFPSLSFRLNFNGEGTRDVQAFSFTSAVSEEEIYLVLPTKLADGDFGPSSRVVVLGLRGELRRFIDFPIAVYKLAVNNNRFFIIDEESELRIFDLASREDSSAGRARQ